MLRATDAHSVTPSTVRWRTQDSKATSSADVQGTSGWEGVGVERLRKGIGMGGDGGGIENGQMGTKGKGR